MEGLIEIEIDIERSKKINFSKFRFFKSMSGDEILNNRKNKFLKLDEPKVS